MTNPVSLDLANTTLIANHQEVQETSAGRTWFPIIRGDPSLPEDQRGLVRVVNLFGLSLCLVGSILLGITIPLSDSGYSSELMDPEYRAISSLRFPCLILGASTLYFAKITTVYLKKTNENQMELSLKLRHKIEEIAKENVHVSSQRN